MGYGLISGSTLVDALVVFLRSTERTKCSIMVYDIFSAYSSESKLF